MGYSFSTSIGSGEPSTATDMTAQDPNLLYRPFRALICEDASDVREVLGFLLRDAGYEVEETGDGNEALHSIRNNTVDILLLDLSLPKVDGFEVLDYLYEHRPGLPVVVMTGLEADDIERHLTKMKRHDLPPMVLKPVDARQLLGLMQMVLNKELPKFGQPPSDGQQDGRH
jgi:CheY-like chemotaxis protein